MPCGLSRNPFTEAHFSAKARADPGAVSRVGVDNTRIPLKPIRTMQALFRLTIR